MKKKQSPILLVTTIVILGAVAAGWNLASSGVFKRDPEAPKLTEARQDEPTSVAQDVQSKVVASHSESPAVKKGMEMMEGSLLEQIPPTNSKPKPNDSSTSAQWYDQQSGSPKVATK